MEVTVQLESPRSNPAFLMAFPAEGCVQAQGLESGQQRPPQEAVRHSLAAEQTVPAAFFGVHEGAAQ